MMRARTYNLAQLSPWSEPVEFQTSARMGERRRELPKSWLRGDFSDLLRQQVQLMPSGGQGKAKAILARGGAADSIAC